MTQNFDKSITYEESYYILADILIYVWTYLNAFLMVNPNIIMKSNIFDIWIFCDIFNISSAHACRMVSVKRQC